MTKKLLLILIALLFFVPVFSQSEQKHTLRTSNTTFGLSTLELLDNYLSPMPYSGAGLRVATENARLINPSNENISIRNRTEFTLGALTNPAGTAGMLYLAVNYAWGMHYHFRLPVENLQILAGSFWDIDFGAKYLARNVNNPVNLDMAANLNLSAIVIYDIPTPRRVVRLRAAFETPIVGYMFVPEQNATYYQIFMLGAYGNFVHFSSMHNKLGLRQSYSVEIPLHNATLRFGISSNRQQHSANDLIFRRNDNTLFFGYTQVFSRFTRRSPAPENFVGY